MREQTQEPHPAQTFGLGGEFNYVRLAHNEFYRIPVRTATMFSLQIAALLSFNHLMHAPSVTFPAAALPAAWTTR